MEKELRNYVLGQLPVDEERRLEERLMVDDEAFRDADGMMRCIEDELVDDYLDRALSPDEKRVFETRLLHRPVMKEKLILGRALQGLGTGRRRQPSWLDRIRAWFQPAMKLTPAFTTAVVLAVIAGGSWSVFQVKQIRQDYRDLAGEHAEMASLSEKLKGQVDQERAASARLGTDLEAARARIEEMSAQRPLLPAIASALLQPGGVQRSSGEVVRVNVPAGRRLIEFRLDIGLDEYPTYSATLADSNGNEIMTHHGLSARPAGDTVIIAIEAPSTMFPPDDYHFSLSGVTNSGEIEPIDRYHFRVVTE